MNPETGDLFPTVESARAAGVPHPVQLVGRDQDVMAVSEAARTSTEDADGTHACPRDGCEARIRRNLLACPGHWSLVTPATQREVYAAYRTRTADLMRHVRAVQAAVAEMNR